ncbi:MAG TPA: T9SS type A sorting domain-containing protein [Ohtaekwangia sp.]|uniref:T9SS type A sorting domain-containing protein n=1 Tax=Ohtaekwangia sp. TaxID=2066019 RepID=UPI002F9394CD
MRTFFSCFFLVLSFNIQAQFTYTLDQSIPVEGEQATLTMPWVGGLNAAQYNTMDLNNDGLEDLVLFERMAGKLLTFLNQNNQYQYAPEYESFFPSDITNWLLLRDFNCDGKKDVFTGNVLGIKVYTNVTQPGGTLTWKQYIFYDSGGKSEVLLTKGFSTTKINLQLQFDDLPNIADVDGDGDLDIFNVRFANNGTLEFHRNNGIENHNTCDSLDFERITNQWGNFTECSCGVYAYNGTACRTNGKVEHAGGKSLLMLDVTHDGQLDVLLSEATCSQLFMLPNQGTLLSPVIESEQNFPSSNAANFLYPAAYYEDVDFDGLKDLISTPNIFTKTILSTDLSRSNWYYKNTGTNEEPTFTFGQTNFLQDQMIDVGDDAVPAFMDFDMDGDFDLFISQNTSAGIVATILVYENIGSNTEPHFKLTEENYLNFTSLLLYNLKIQFADFNTDGKPDLVFTATSLQDGVTRLFYIPNQASAGLNLSTSDLQVINFDTNSVSNFAPTENIAVLDVDLDGKMDLIQGKSNGALYYWKNSGNGSSPNFSLESDAYLNIGSSVLRQNLACAVGDLDNDGASDLVIGDQTGEVRVVGNFRQASNADNAVGNVVWNSLSESYEARNLGGRIWPTVVNIFATTRPAIVAGNVTGGLVVLRHDNTNELPGVPVIGIYPNPVARGNNLNVSSDRSIYMQIFSSTGQMIRENIAIQPNQVNPIDEVTQLARGLYILRFVWNNQSVSKKIVVY